MPKTSRKYTEPISTVVTAETLARIERNMPSYAKLSAYVRDLINTALEVEEAKKGGARKLRTMPVVEDIRETPPCAGIFEDRPGSDLCGGCGEAYDNGHYRR
jgi:hypothetical protein